MQTQELTNESLLKRLNLPGLNEMQVATLERFEKKKDLIIHSATGSGKTLAFLLPIIPLLDRNNKSTQALIIVPTRELALQIEQVFKSLGTGFKVSTCYGGHKREIEENNLLQPPALIIGTPGRLADHIRRGNITLATITTLVLDEYDKSFEFGFLEDISFILKSLPAIERRILTSATESVELPDFITRHQPETLNFLSDHHLKEEKLDIKVLYSSEKDKLGTLFSLLCFIGDRSTVIFCNHREAVERTSKFLSDKGIINTFYHGAMEQKDREIALSKFGNGSVHFLVTTDLASRGLDIPHIRYIIHYHLPTNEDAFTHRNGRTARMDASGSAILILNQEEQIPSYLKLGAEPLVLPFENTIPEKPKWTTFFVGAGKKDKINKIDIVGFLSNKGDLKKEDIGKIDVKDFFAFVAIRKSKAGHTLQLIKDQKLKNRKIKIEVAK